MKTERSWGVRGGQVDYREASGNVKGMEVSFNVGFNFKCCDYILYCNLYSPISICNVVSDE